MIKTLNYIVGIAVLLVAIGIPLRIYIQNADERERKQMLEDMGALPSGNETDFSGSSLREETKETLRNLSTVGESMDALNDLMPNINTRSSSSDEKKPFTLEDYIGQANLNDSAFINVLNPPPDLPDHLFQPQGILPDNVTDNPEAMDRYLKTLEQDPNNHKAMYDLAIKYVEAGDINKAEKLADQIKQYDQSMAGSLRELIKTIKRQKSQ